MSPPMTLLVRDRQSVIPSSFDAPKVERVSRLPMDSKSTILVLGCSMCPTVTGNVSPTVGQL